MGRGQGGSEQAQVAAPRRGVDRLSVAGDLGIPVVAASAVRSVKDRTFIKDVNEWKRQEQEYINGVMEELRNAASRHASSDEGWRKYLKLYAECPEYSALNNYWARSQLGRRGVDPGGIILSESAWKALGRRVKSEYSQPGATGGKPARNRDERFGFDSDRDWEDTYACEMTKPLGRQMWPARDGQGNPIYERDASGNVIYENGRAKRKMIPGPVSSFGTFMAYHEDATEALDGGEAPPLPETPWANATGSDDDARKLLTDLERVCTFEGSKIEFVDGPMGERQGPNSLGDRRLGGENAVYDKDSKTIRVNRGAPIAEQATSALRAVCESVSEPYKDDQDARTIARAGAESAKYVIASLYGLDSEEQTFPHLSEMAEDGKAVSKVESDTHRRVKAILGVLDPKMQAKVRADGEARAERKAKASAKKSKSRSSKRRSQRSAAPAAA